MTDRELLELAAKAAGMTYSSEYGVAFGEDETGNFMEEDWNPLTDDGDALRLAVRLGITFRRLGRQMAACGIVQINEYCDDDYDYAAARRVIVKVAAETGRLAQQAQREG